MSYNFTLQRDEISTLALQLLNIIGWGQTPDSDLLTSTNLLLNSLLKLWQIDGILVTKRKIGYLFPQLNQSSYELGSVSGSDNCTNSYISTVSTVTSAISTNTITLQTVTGMSISDNIGIELDDHTRQWTTITNIDSLNKIITLNAALTAQATSGITVITYTNKINRPLEVYRGTGLDLSTSNRVENVIRMLSYDEYLNLSVKSTPGTKVLNAYYNKQLNNSLPYTSTLYLYPVPSTVKMIIPFSYQDSLQDMDNSTDYLDLPQEYLYPIAFNLADMLTIPYGKVEEIQLIKPEAERLRLMVKRSNTDKTPLRIHLSHLGKYY